MQKFGNPANKQDSVDKRDFAKEKAVEVWRPLEMY